MNIRRKIWKFGALCLYGCKALWCDGLLPVGPVCVLVLFGWLSVVLSLCMSAGRWWVVLCDLSGPGQLLGGYECGSPLSSSLACSTRLQWESSVDYMGSCREMVLHNKTVHLLFLHIRFSVLVLPRARPWRCGLTIFVDYIYWRGPFLLQLEFLVFLEYCETLQLCYIYLLVFATSLTLVFTEPTVMTVSWNGGEMVYNM